MCNKMPLQGVKQSSLTLILSALVAEPLDLSVWVSTGRHVIERAWSLSSEFATSLTGSLLECSWGGFKQFALPPFLARSLALLSAGGGARADTSEGPDIRLRTLRVLATLARDGLLKSPAVDSTWQRGFVAWAQGFLDDFRVSRESASRTSWILPFSFFADLLDLQVLLLREVVAIIPAVDASAALFPSYAKALRRLTDDLTSSSAPEATASDWANASWAVGTLCRALAKQAESVVETGGDTSLLADTIIVICKLPNCSEQLLAAVAELEKS